MSIDETIKFLLDLSRDRILYKVKGAVKNSKIKVTLRNLIWCAVSVASYLKYKYKFGHYLVSL